MKAKKSSSENVEQVEQNGNELGNMYCTQEMGKILQSVTLENLSSLGFKEDVWLQYTRILCFAIMSAIGLYGAAFTSIGKNKLILKIVLVCSIYVVQYGIYRLRILPCYCSRFSMIKSSCMDHRAD
uniref:Uncharacterized protein n=1 Tax=Babesia bovis TaxID=5865 RepID=S6B0H4_BABBO|nr:hypothetical protein [Babesia bovis]